MNYRETLFFIGKCLTINNEKHNLEIIKNQLKNNTVNWDSVVKISTSHYVFTALYNNFKKANLLDFLPNDLVDFMQHITQLNYERNLKIIEQVKDLNTLLLSHNITPIFLKGVGYIFQDMYLDISDRMIADIDFIVSKKDYLKTIRIIKKSGYTKVNNFKYHSPLFRHHPRLQKKNCVAAVEIHKEVLIEKFTEEFNYEIIKKNCFKANNISVLNYSNQLALSILSTQINDDAYYIKNLTLKHAYDTYLLSKKTDTIKAFESYIQLKHPLQSFVASCNQVFNTIDSLAYINNPEIEKYLQDFNTYLIDDEKRKKDYKKLN